MLSLMPNTIFALHCSSAFGHTSTGAIALPFRCYPYSLGSFRVGLTIPLCFPFSCSPSLRWTVPLSCSALIDFSMTFCQTSPLTTVVHCQDRHVVHVAANSKHCNMWPHARSFFGVWGSCTWCVTDSI